MSWIAVLLIGVAVADLAHSVRPVPIVDECMGAIVAVLRRAARRPHRARRRGGAGRDRRGGRAWGQTVTRGFGRGPAWVPLLVLGRGADGRGRRLGEGRRRSAGWSPTGSTAVGVPVLEGLDPTRFLLLLAVFLVQLSTGNVVVRLVLTATGTVNPAKRDAPPDPELRLKGGRLLGPMERVFIVGLGLAGHLTAASIVIAAKGLLRFPELQSKDDQAADPPAHRVLPGRQLRELAGRAGLAGAARALTRRAARTQSRTRTCSPPGPELICAPSGRPTRVTR